MTPSKAIDAELVDEREAPRESTAIVHYDPSQFVVLAIERDLDITKLRELMALEKEWRADKAKAEFAIAMSRFGGLKQVVEHNRRGTTAGNTPFTYADYPAMVEAVTPWLAECGLSFTHRQDPPVMSNNKIGYIMVHCRVQHNAGHVEEYDFPAVPDTRLEGKVSPSQLIQLAITYAKRQTLAMGLGVATAEDRDDIDSHGHKGKTQKAEKQSVVSKVREERKPTQVWQCADELKARILELCTILTRQGITREELAEDFQAFFKSADLKSHDLNDEQARAYIERLSTSDKESPVSETQEEPTVWKCHKTKRQTIEKFRLMLTEQYKMTEEALRQDMTELFADASVVLQALNNKQADSYITHLSVLVNNRSSSPQ